jgi:hypothetical protein
MHLPHLGTNLKLRRDRNRALAFATIHKEPFPLLHYCGIGDLPSVVSEAQTDGKSDEVRSDYGTIGL